MIDPTTGQDLQTIEPQIDEAQALQDAEFMAEQPIEEVPLPDEREAGIVSDVARFIGKSLGITPDVPIRNVSPSATPTPKASTATPTPTPEKPKLTQEQSSGLKAWANKQVLGAKPIVKEKKIGEMVVTKPKVATEVTPMPLDANPNKAFDLLERGESPKFATFNPDKEAANLLEADIDQFDDTLSHQINFNTLDNEDDVNAVIASIAESNKANIDFERRGVVGDDQLMKFAQDIGADESFVRDVFMRESGGAIPPAEYIVAMRQVLNQSGTQLKILADKVSQDLSPKGKIDFARQFDFHRKFQSKFMGVRAEYGRGLRALGVQMQNEDDTMMVLGAMEKDIDISKLAQMISDSETAQGINKMVNAYADNGKYAADFLYTSYMGSMLSGVSTQVLNIGGTLANISINMAERKVASWLPKGEHAADEVMNDEVSAMLIGYTSSFKDALKAGWKTLKTGDPYKGMGAFGEDYSMPLPSEKFALDGVSATAADFALKALSYPIRNVMGSSDAFFKVLNERAQLSALTYREARAMVERGEIAPEQFQATLSELAQSPNMQAEAEGFAREMAYQETPGKMLQSITGAIQKTPGARWVVPFVKTLGNITRQTLVERTPAAVLQKKFRDDVAAGGARRNLALTKVGLGTGIMAGAFQLADGGKITGPLSNDKAERQAQTEAGIKPFSFVFDNDDGTKTYVPYTGLEPFATLFGISASIADYNKKSSYVDLYDGEEEKYNSMVSDVLVAVSENTLNKTFMVGLQTVMDAVSEGDAKAFQRLMNNYANTMLPYAGLRRNITKDMDDFKRSTNGTLEYIQSQIPTMSEALPPVRDVFGEMVPHDYTYIRWSPSTTTDDVVKTELFRLNTQTKRNAVPKARAVLGKQKITPEDSEKWFTYSRRDHTDSQGRTLKEKIYDTIHSEEYQDLIEDDKVDLIANITKQHDMSALKQLSQDDEELFMRLHAKDIVKKARVKIEKEGMAIEDAIEESKGEYQDIFGGVE